MAKMRGIATAGAIAVIGLGVGVPGASAYSISGGAYTATPTVDHSMTVAGAYTVTCPAAQTAFSGVATGADSTAFTPSYGSTGACNVFGYPVTILQSGTWIFKVTSGPDASGFYGAEVQIPFGTTTTISVPIAGCTTTTTGSQTFQNGIGGNVVRVRNTSSGAQIEASVNGIAYSASGCPFSSGSDGVYSTVGVVDVPGVTIS